MLLAQFFSCHQSCGVLHGILVHDRSPPRIKTIFCFCKFISTKWKMSSWKSPSLAHKRSLSQKIWNKPKMDGKNFARVPPRGAFRPVVNRISPLWAMFFSSFFNYFFSFDAFVFILYVFLFFLSIFFLCRSLDFPSHPKMRKKNEKIQKPNSKIQIKKHRSVSVQPVCLPTRLPNSFVPKGSNV